MKPVLLAVAFVAATGVATRHATEGSWRDIHGIEVTASEVARSLISGIILGANVGPYLSGLVPAHIESRVTASGHAAAQTIDSYPVADE